MRLTAWLPFLKDCAELKKRLDVSIKLLSTIHFFAAPTGMTGTALIGRDRESCVRGERRQGEQAAICRL